MTQYETYLRSTAPDKYFKINSPTADATYRYYNEVGSDSITYKYASGSSATGNGQKPTLFAEDDGSYSTGFRYKNYLEGSFGNLSTSLTFQIAVMNNEWHGTEVHCLFGGYPHTLYVSGGVLCWYNGFNPSFGTNNATLIGPALDEGSEYLITYSIATAGGYNNSQHVKIYVNGSKVVDSLDSGVSITGALGGQNMQSVLTNYSESEASCFGKQTDPAICDAFCQEVSFWSRQLSDYEVSKLGYLFWKNANPVVVSGSIVEGYHATDFRVRMHESATGELVHQEVTASGSFSALVPDLEYYVIVSAEQGEVWFPSMAPSIGDKVYPTNPSATRFYFECTTAGVAGTTEPSWNLNLDNTTNDGTVVWTVVEGLIQPITHAPVRGV